MKTKLSSIFTVVTIAICLLLTPLYTLAAPPVENVDENKPFQWSDIVDFDPMQSGGYVFFTVPAGKRLVIEYVTGNVGIDTGDVVAFYISTTVNGVLTKHWLLPTAVGPAGGFAKSYIANQSLILYADAETVVTIYAGNTSGGRAAMFASVSGYLVPN